MATKKLIVKNKPAVSTAIVVTALQKKAQPLFNRLQKIDRIETKDDLIKANEQTKLLKALKNEAVAEKKRMTEGIEQSLKAIKQHFKPFEDQVNKVEDGIKELIKIYYDKMDQLEMKVEKDFADGKIKKLDTYTSKLSEIQNNKDGASRRKLDRLFIVDSRKIPRDYLMPDEEKIMAAIKDGIKVSGCEIRKVNSIAI